MGPTALRGVRAEAPVRIADLGGWTDTWFAGHGLVCNIAVEPGVEVTVTHGPGHGVGIHAVDFGDRYDLDGGRGRHPLLEATVDEVGVPAAGRTEIEVRSAVPPGAATGTSAAVTVALVAALRAIGGDERPDPQALARTAHRIESVRLGRQSGIQDQLASAHGGINLITMRRYPDAEVTPIAVAPGVAAELERRLVLVFLGRSHVSSAVHEQVIAELEAGGPAALRRLDPLRAAAAAGHDALRRGDLAAYGDALVANHEAQAALHPGVVPTEARTIIATARAAGAIGWKVNGAGGSGGSLTLLSGDAPGSREALVAAVGDTGDGVRCLPVRLARRGVRVELLG